MVGSWAFLALFYGLLKGARELLKKKGLQQTDRLQFLFFYTALAFLFSLPFAGQSIPTEPILLLPVAAKSAVLFFAWMFSFSAMAHMDVSVYGIVDLSRLIFSTLLSFILLSEQPRWNRILGLVLVLFGLVLLRITSGKKGIKSERNPAKYLILALLSCLLNSVSSIIDKVALTGTGLKGTALLFWYLLFLTVFYGLYFLIRGIRLRFSTLKCPWVWGLSFLLVLGEWCIFQANSDPASLVSVMTLMKQSSCVVTIAGGQVFFREGQVLRKLLCAGIVVCGIAVSAFFS